MLACWGTLTCIFLLYAEAELIITNSLNSTRVSLLMQWFVYNRQVYNEIEINRSRACHWVELSTETSRTHDGSDSNDGTKDITTWTEPSVD